MRLIARLSRLLAAALIACGAGSAAAAEVMDLAGRTVRLPDKVERVILGEGRHLAALAILDRDDPTRRVVGLMGEFAKLDPDGYAQFVAAFPRLAELPTVGSASAASFDVESAIALAPDVVIFGLLGHGPSAESVETVAQLETAGIAVVFIDFRRDPLVNTPRSIDLLGTVLGREAEAAAFVAFYQAELRRVTDRLDGYAGPRPTVFLENRVGLGEECCPTIARGLIADFIAAAGGDNIAAPIVPGVVGTLSLEQLLTADPDVYIGTAVGSVAAAQAGPGRVLLGPAATEDLARASLAGVLARPGFQELAAVRSGRAYALWHHFYNSPLNVAAVQAIAKWLHPELFADLDPEATLRELYDRFQAVPFSGLYWIGPE